MLVALGTMLGTMLGPIFNNFDTKNLSFVTLMRKANADESDTSNTGNLSPMNLEQNFACGNFE